MKFPKIYLRRTLKRHCNSSLITLSDSCETKSLVSPILLKSFRSKSQSLWNVSPEASVVIVDWVLNLPKYMEVVSSFLLHPVLSLVASWRGFRQVSRQSIGGDRVLLWLVCTGTYTGMRTQRLVKWMCDGRWMVRCRGEGAGERWRRDTKSNTSSPLGHLLSLSRVNRGCRVLDKAHLSEKKNARGMDKGRGGVERDQPTLRGGQK